MGKLPKLYRIEIVRGDPLDIYGRVWDGDRSRGILKDFTGYSGRMHVRPDADSDLILLAPLLELGTFTTKNPKGVDVECNFHIAATHLQTQAYSFDGLAVFDAEWISPSGVPWTFMAGYVVLRKDATRG